MKRTILKTIAIALAMTLIMSTVAFAAETPATVVPEDVKGKPYEPAVLALMEKSIITGDQDGLFHPEDSLTRAQACIIVVKSMNPPSVDVVGTPTQPVTKSGFTDMKGYGWAEGYVNYAVKTGVTKGYGNGKFGPSDKVSADELATMILRATGYTDKSLTGTWPTNYVEKGKEVGLYEDIEEKLIRTKQAPKWMAAQMDYNMLDEIVAANLKPETGTTPGEEDKFVPGVTKMSYGVGTFNADMTTYAGKPISNDVVVYTYGVQKDYKADMTFSKKTEEYMVGTIYKYKNAKTPCFYNMVGGKIANMVIPMDAGFSGRIYGVINGNSTTINGDNESVVGLQTLTAMKEITWLAKKGLSAPTTTLDGTVFELYASDGEIQSISIDNDSNKEGYFEEISGANAWVDVEKYGDTVVTTSGGSLLFAVKQNAAIYVLSDDGKEYKTGSASSIKAGKQIRAYDISDDKQLEADIVVVKN